MLGIDPKAVTVDFAAVMERMRRLRSEISDNDSASRFASDLGVDVFQVGTCPALGLCSCIFLSSSSTALHIHVAAIPVDWLSLSYETQQWCEK